MDPRTAHYCVMDTIINMMEDDSDRFDALPDLRRPAHRRTNSADASEAKASWGMEDIDARDPEAVKNFAVSLDDESVVTRLEDQKLVAHIAGARAHSREQTQAQAKQAALLRQSGAAPLRVFSEAQTATAQQVRTALADIQTAQVALNAGIEEVAAIGFHLSRAVAMSPDYIPFFPRFTEESLTPEVRQAMGTVVAKLREFSRGADEQLKALTKSLVVARTSFSQLSQAAEELLASDAVAALTAAQN